MKILCVDDNDLHRLSMSNLLAHAGYEVISATTGNEAIRKTVEESPDAVLLDITLPDVDGYEVCSGIKADPRTASVPVIFYTGQVGGVAKQRCELVGGDAFFTYPIAIEHMETAIHAAVIRAAKTRPTRPANQP
jgi:CheY-like chemotaxis protein